MTQMSTPRITPLARRLAEDAGVSWRTLSGEGNSAITERDVLEHLTQVVTNTLPTSAPPTSTPPTPAPEEAETIDFSLLASSLSKVLEELLATEEEAEAPPVSNLAAVTPSAIPAAPTTSPAAAASDLDMQHAQMLLEAERRAHAETQRQLGALKESGARQKARAEQLKPLSAEIRRLGSALGVANAEMERLRPLESRVASLQEQLEATRADEARVRLLCRELQERQEWLEEELQLPPRWQFWRRASQE